MSDPFDLDEGLDVDPQAQEAAAEAQEQARSIEFLLDVPLDVSVEKDHGAPPPFVDATATPSHWPLTRVLHAAYRVGCPAVTPTHAPVARRDEAATAK